VFYRAAIFSDGGFHFSSMFNVGRGSKSHTRVVVPLGFVCCQHFFFVSYYVCKVLYTYLADLFHEFSIYSLRLKIKVTFCESMGLRSF
jgi:hypothetical protein